MNVNFGIFPELPERIRDKKERYEAIANRALEDMKEVVTLTK
jgi:methylenetetrahydrofolate--tRNA-(uracil-5-)-methyltransferase